MAVPRANGIVVYPAQGSLSETGTVTCFVRDQRTSLLYAMSCLHVFSMLKKRGTAGNVGGRVTRRGGGAVIANVSGIRGPLAAGQTFSIDGQLAEVRHPTRVKAFFTTLKYNGIWASAMSDMPKQMWIQTPRGPLKVTKAARRTDPINYPGIGMVRHKMLLSLTVSGGRTRGGDSGSPITSARKGGRLVGMHIAGRRNANVSYAIPAWYLFPPHGFLPGPRQNWAVVNP